MKWRERLAVALFLCVAGWAAFTWNRCMWQCSALGRFGTFTTDGCYCLPPAQEP